MQWRKWEDKVLEKDYNADEGIVICKVIFSGSILICESWICPMNNEILISVV